WRGGCATRGAAQPQRRTSIASSAPGWGALERIIDSRKHRRALAAPTDVDVADHEWLGDPAKAHTANRMQVGEGVFARVVEDPAGLEEGRQLQDAMGVEDVGSPHPRAHLDVEVEHVV